MGSYLQKPVVKKETTDGTGEEFQWGSTGMQGWRTNMEDSHIHLTQLSEELKTFALFVVFDGHSGAQYANQAACDFPTFLMRQDPFHSLRDGEKYDSGEIKEGLSKAFLKYDISMKEYKEIATSGCTATGVLITPDHFFFLNIGDSRTVLCKNNCVDFATEDHKPMNQGERQRIEKAGGYVGQGRVNGQLAVSRALGDFEMKGNSALEQTHQLVSSEPDITIVNRSKSEDNYIAICCDGIFDVMSNDELVDLLVKRIPYKRHLRDLCEDVADYCCHKGSKDNLSVILINFNESRIQAVEENYKKDELLDAKIKTLTEEYTHESFKDGKSEYRWETCFINLNNNHPDIFDCNENTMGYGIALKKGLIFKEFDKIAMEYRDSRRAEALKTMDPGINEENN